MLKGEMEVREYLVQRIEGFVGVYGKWYEFNTVDLIKIFIVLRLDIEFNGF